MASAQPGSSTYTQAIELAFQYAHGRHHCCGPVDFLVGISEGDGPAAVALSAGKGRGLRTAARANDGEVASYLHLQAQDGGKSLAASLGQEPSAEHLLIALLDQDAP